jgi:hypothetical protein
MPRASRSGRGLINRLSFYVLPRQIDGLDSTIQRLHLEFKLWGGKVRVRAPNSPDLLRCNQCDQLGHHANACIMDNGLAIRLLMKGLISFHAVSLLALASGARIGFLGSNVDEMKPGSSPIGDNRFLFYPVHHHRAHSPPRTHCAASAVALSTRACKRAGRCSLGADGTECERRVDECMTT